MQQQEIFDTVVRHLAKQGKPAMNAVGKCLYRGPDGTKCAVGFLIPDDIYVPEMDQGSLGMLLGVVELISKFKTLPDFFRINTSLLSELQAVHDHQPQDAWNRNDLVEQLHILAERYELNDTVINEAFPNAS